VTGATLAAAQVAQGVYVSIHAPVTGATSRSSIRPARMLLFQSTRP